MYQVASRVAATSPSQNSTFPKFFFGSFSISFINAYFSACSYRGAYVTPPLHPTPAGQRGRVGHVEALPRQYLYKPRLRRLRYLQFHKLPLCLSVGSPTPPYHPAEEVLPSHLAVSRKEGLAEALRRMQGNLLHRPPLSSGTRIRPISPRVSNLSSSQTSVISRTPVQGKCPPRS